MHALRWIYGFDRWHADAAWACRPYKQTVVRLVDALAPGTVVEIGAGLGDIIGRVDAPTRSGYDIDTAAVRAARLLHPRGVTFLVGSVADVVEAPIDVVIMVNWIHNLSSTELERLLQPLLSRTRYLLLDAIDADAPTEYRYRHDFGFLAAYADHVSVTRAPGEPRSFYLFRVRRHPG